MGALWDYFGVSSAVVDFSLAARRRSSPGGRGVLPG